MGADRWGVSDGFHDGAGTWHGASPAARAAVHAALRSNDPGAHGHGTEDRGPSDPGTVWVVRPGDDRRVHGPATLQTEDGATVELQAGQDLPPDLPPGYHRLHLHDDQRTLRVIAAPDACFLPEHLHTWGWAVQLYAVRSRRSWGIGDLRDLRTLDRWSAARGAGMVLVNPMHATVPVLHQQPSPYFPSSRCHRNPLYLAMEDVPGWSEVAHELEPLAARARALLDSRRIDRDEVFRCKYAALERLWEQWRARPTDDHRAFDAWRRSEGDTLRDFATHSVIVEQRRTPWTAWPEDLRRPRASGVERIRRDHHDRVSFHEWVQWLVDRQLAAAADDLDVMTDLAVGVDRGGADAWMWQDSFALDIDIGAPPDDFNRLGQDWGLPPFDPWRLRADAYEPFVRTVRAAFRHAGGLRIDHVMGLFRLYWIPRGMGPADGCYVYMPHRDLLAIVALESHRAGAYVVGEDLGTIEPYVRDELAATNVLSYRLAQFESTPSSALPRRALAAFSTHDLPTIAGYWTGSDLAAQRSIGLDPDEDAMRWLRRSMATRAGFPDVGDLDVPDDLDDRAGLVTPPSPEGQRPTLHDLVLGIHRELATAPSMIVTATLDDVLGVEERPNIPGTIDEWPNWRIALPVPLEEVLDDPRTSEVAAVLARRPGDR